MTPKAFECFYAVPISSSVAVPSTFARRWQILLSRFGSGRTCEP